jgi:hypothetical protein
MVISFSKYLKYYSKYNLLVGGVDLVHFLDSYPLDFFSTSDILNLLQTSRSTQGDLSPELLDKITKIMEREEGIFQPRLREIQDDNEWGLDTRGQQAEHAYLIYYQAVMYLGEISTPLSTPTKTSILTRCRLLKKISQFVENPHLAVETDSESDESDESDDGSVSVSDYE